MLESIESKKLEYQRLSPEEMEKRGILGRLVGVCADCVDGTRNGRRYSEELWEKVFADPIVQEKFKNGVCYGELGHPADREEVDMEKVAICMPELPKKGKDGKLRAVFDILNTPCGKILKTLCDYGSNLGISSRGTGDTIQGFDGNEEVDPETYVWECFDIVTVPAVERARLQYMTESIDKKKQLKRALSESIKRAKIEDRKVMVEAIKGLNLGLEEQKQSSSSDVKINAEPKNKVADNTGTAIIKELQTALQENKKLEAKISDLQERLSVCYAKEVKYEEEIDVSRDRISALAGSKKLVEGLKKKVESLSQEVSEQERELQEKDRKLSVLENRKELANKKQESLNESIQKEETRSMLLQKKVSTLTEKLESANKMLDSKEKKYSDTIAEMKQDAAIKQKEYTEKIEKSNSLVEKYRKIARIAVDRYIESTAVRLGVRSEEIKSKLPENYSFSDIDRVCEDLQGYQLNMSKLPFDLAGKKKVSVKVTESVEPINPTPNFDDDVDEGLKALAGLN